VKELEKQFDEAMFVIYRRAKDEAGWGPHRCPVCVKNTLRLCPRG